MQLVKKLGSNCCWRTLQVCGGVLIVAAVALVFAFGTALSPVHAGFDVITGDLLRVSDGNGAPGGIFNVDVLYRGTITDFETFCVEMTEHINFGTTYYVQNIGLLSNGGGKTLGAQSAWLYTKFLQQSAAALPGYIFVNPSSIQARDQANAIQLGIWYGMGYNSTEVTNLAGWSSSYISGTLSPLLNPWISNFDYDVNNNLWSGVGNVRIMNLRKFDVVSNGPITLADGRHIKLTDYIQDQLTSVTPELPSFYSACAVLGCALLWRVNFLVRKRPSSAGST